MATLNLPNSCAELELMARESEVLLRWRPIANDLVESATQMLGHHAAGDTNLASDGLMGHTMNFV